MHNGPIDDAARTGSADILEAFNAPFAEREKQPETQQNGLILFSFGRNGGFTKPTDRSDKSAFVA